MILAWLTGCILMNNEPPLLIAVNDVPFSRLRGFEDPLSEAFQYHPGEPLTLRIDAKDREGDGFQVWFPRAPGGFAFEPEAREGTWDVPDDAPPYVFLELVLADDHPRDPRAQTYPLGLYDPNGSFETGIPDL